MRSGSIRTENTCFPEAALQYDTDKDAAIIRLTYAENREDLRYLVFYGFSGQEDALSYCSENQLFY